MMKYQKAMAALSTLCALSVLLSGNSAFALGTTAGTSIPNIAVVDYSDPYGVLQPRVSSPTCTVTVAQNAGVQVTPTSGSVTEKAGNSIYYPVTVTNTGNFSDTFSLSTTSTKGWSPKVIKDDNGDGVHQSTEVTVLTSSGAVAPDATLKAFISETIPSTITAATSDSVAFKATSATNTTLSASSTVTVSATVTTATAGIMITPTSGTKSDKAGSVSYFPLTIANTGTASDTFSLAVGDTMGYGPKIIRDDNGDGVYQTTEVTALSSTGSLASKAVLKCLVVMSIPTTATAGASDVVTVRGISGMNSAVSATSTITWSILAATPGTVTPKWTTRLGGAVSGSAAVVNGVAYVGAEDGYVYAIAATTASGKTPGTIIWRYNAGGPVLGRPMVTQSSGVVSSIYIVTKTGNVIAISPTGGSRWVSNQTTTGAALTSTPMMGGSLLYVSVNGYVVALNPSTGQRVYISPKLQSASNMTSPIVYTSTNSVWVATDYGYVYCLSATLSSIRWQVYLGGSVTGEMSYLNASVPQLIMGTSGGRVYSLNAATGALNMGWRNTGYAQVDGSVKASPFVDNRTNTIYIATSTHKWYALKGTDGTVVSNTWPYSPTGYGEFRTSPLVLPFPSGVNTLIDAGIDGKFHLASVTNPSVDTIYTAPDSFYGSPAVSGVGTSDVIVIGDIGGRVYGFPLQ